MLYTTSNNYANNYMSLQVFRGKAYPKRSRSLGKENLLKDATPQFSMSESTDLRLEQFKMFDHLKSNSSLDRLNPGVN